MAKKSKAVETPSDDGVVDITDLVEKLKATWVKWATTWVVSLAIDVAPFMAFALFKNLLEFFVSKVASAIAEGVEMQGFFLNTAVRKASQAQDFVDAVAVVQGLPPTTTDEEYENAEKRQMAAFRALTIITR